MLVIRPIQEKTLQNELTERCGAVYDADSLAYAAYDCEDDGESVRALLGVCQFAFRSGYGSINALRPAPDTSDREALMIMARTAMNFLYRCGYPRAVMEDGAADTELTDSLGFRCDDDGKNAIDLIEFYKSPCHYRAKQANP